MGIKVFYLFHILRNRDKYIYSVIAKGCIEKINIVFFNYRKKNYEQKNIAVRADILKTVYLNYKSESC